jgi:K+-transporting ATPase A subunit
MVGDQRQGWAIFGAMAVLLLLGIVTVYWAEAHGNPAFSPYHVDAAPSALQAGGNIEGKEVRFRIAPSSSFATVTSDAGAAVYAIPLLAVAGSLARKKRVPPSAGSVPTHRLQFVRLFVGVVLIMDGLTYFPALSLGPVAEQFAMNRGIHYAPP